MFTFHNLFQGAAGLCLMMCVLSIFVNDGTVWAAVIWAVIAAVFLCAANACKPKG